MIIKKAVYAKKRKTISVRISDDIKGCDCCRKKIGEKDTRLDVTVFNHDEESQHLDFCSWKCVLKFLPKLKCNYFVSLPFLHYDDSERPGCNAKDFFKLLKQPK